MGRPKASELTDGAVQSLIDWLFSDFPGPDETIASLAERSGLGHETVRGLARGGRRLRSGPGFFVVARIAHARGLSLDDLARAAGLGGGSIVSEGE